MAEKSLGNFEPAIHTNIAILIKAYEKMFGIKMAKK